MILIRRIFFLTFLSAFAFFTASAQSTNNQAAALAAADSTHFSINTQGGWLLYNSYAASYKADSLQLQLIIQNSNTINLSNEQYIGKIKTASLRPQTEQILFFMMLDKQFYLRVKKDGKCNLKQVSGPVFTDDPLTILVSIFFKK
jgi:hypothetical protein